MREIKFRGKRLGNGEWVYGSLQLMQHSKLRCVIWNQLESISHLVDPETVGQFTGLKDKNGKDIYEGDTLSFPDGYDGDLSVSAGSSAVEWVTDYNESGFYVYGLPEGRWSDFEVIGNIHDS